MKSETHRVARLWRGSRKRLFLDYWWAPTRAMRGIVADKAEAERIIADSGVTQILEDETVTTETLG